MVKMHSALLVLAALLSAPAFAEEPAAAAEEAGMQTARIVTPRPDKMKPPAAQASAREVVDALYGRLLYIMQEGEKLGFTGRYDALKDTVERSFDLPMMTRFASGAGWYNATPVQQQKLINAFSNFSVSTYASRFKAFDQEEFQILGEKPAAGGGVIVETQLMPADDPAVTLNYLLRQDKQGQWRINDVYLDATISEMATRRSEFSSVIRDHGVDALIENIDRKSQSMRSL